MQCCIFELFVYKPRQNINTKIEGRRKERQKATLKKNKNLSIAIIFFASQCCFKKEKERESRLDKV